MSSQQPTAPLIIDQEANEMTSSNEGSVESISEDNDYFH